MSDDFDITLERKLESKADGRGGGVTAVRRLELITGAARREARASFHEAGNAAPADRPAANPAPRPRRRKGSQSPSPAVSNDAPAVAPVMIAEAGRSAPRISSQPPAVGSIEIAIADAVVRVIGQAETEAIVAVLRA